jgi:protein-disulfide isomerase
MVDAFFDNAADISSTTVHSDSIKFAKKENLDVGKFTKCVEDPAVLEQVKAVKLEGVNAGVQSTPTLFVNGRIKRGIRDMDDLKPLIDEKLKEAKK